MPPRPLLPAALLALLAFAALAAGCSSPPKPPPPTLVVAAVTTSDDVNVDRAGRASPLMVRVYELKSRTAFEAADYMALFEQDKQALGAELIASDEWIVAPKQEKSLARELAPEARFIGVVAAYRDIERARWRAIVEVAPHKVNRVAVRADALAVSATHSAK